MKSGIYQIRNLTNNKIYIGSATYFPGRFGGHRNDLRKNKHNNRYLQNAWNKYGESNFVFEVLFTCPKEDLIRLEQYHINNYKPEYNICKIAGNTLGVKYTDEVRKRLSDIAKNRIFSEETKKRIGEATKVLWSTTNTEEKLREATYKSIYQICPDTLNIVREFKSIREASNLFNKDHSSLARAARGVSYLVCGYCWCFTKDYSEEFMKSRYKNTTHEKTVCKYDLMGNYITEYKSLSKAALDNNVSVSVISDAVLGKIKTSAGFIWKFKNIKNANITI